MFSNVGKAETYCVQRGRESSFEIEHEKAKIKTE